MTAEALVEVKGLHMHFPAGGKYRWGAPSMIRAVDGVDLTIRKGETLGLVGESGSGKSTIGRSILQFYRPTAGSVSFEGVELTRMSARTMRTMRRRMQIIFQDPFSSLDPRMKVGEIIGEPLDIHRLAKGPARTARINELLSLVGLSSTFADRYPHEFSGGQRQRIGIARALAVEPAFIVADEPISALDVSIQAQIINLLADLQTEFGLTYLFVAHDLAVVRYISDRVAVMYLGRLVELAPADDLYGSPMHPYTAALLSAVPTLDPEAESRRQRIILSGEMPNAIDPPSGCHFHTRCGLRATLGNPDECQTQTPDLVEREPGHFAACHFANAVGDWASAAGKAATGSISLSAVRPIEKDT